MSIKEAVSSIIAEIDNPDREGLKRTPERHTKFLEEFLQPPEFSPTVFNSEGYDEMIVQDSVVFYSLCEHHLLPFFGTGTIAYIPKDKIIGLSKLARTIEHFSRRLQNQERITSQVCGYLQSTLDPKGVGVILQARHMCMEMRGVKKPGAYTTTSALKGLFKTNSQTRQEFLSFRRNIQ